MWERGVMTEAASNCVLGKSSISSFWVRFLLVSVDHQRRAEGNSAFPYFCTLEARGAFGSGVVSKAILPFT